MSVESDAMVVETTAGQVTDVLKRLGIPEDRAVILTIEPEDWLTAARREARVRVIAAGLTDDEIDRMIEEARGEVQRIPK